MAALGIAETNGGERPEGFLDRGLHRVYWREGGAKDGTPVLILPSGPGGGHSPAAMELLSDGPYRIVQIDPRGCGRSEPSGELAENTAQNQIDDLEALRVALGIDRWLILGHLWGAALALAYGQTHPDRCLGIVVASVYVGDRADRDWFFGGIAAMLPQDWDELLSQLPLEERGDPLQAYRRRITDPDPAVHLPAARAMMRYDTAIVRYWPGAQAPDGTLAPDDLAFLRIFLHYLANDFFLGDTVLEGAAKLKAVPGAIVQGRFDVASGAGSAYRLAKAWPEARLITPLGGCGYRHEPMASAVRRAVSDVLQTGGTATAGSSKTGLQSRPGSLPKHSASLQ